MLQGVDRHRSSQPQAHDAPLTSCPPPCLAGLGRDGLLQYFDDAWQLNELLFSSLAPGAIYQQPDPLRHPLVFYYGHTAAFYINKLVLAGVMESGLNPHFEELFAKGVDPASAKDLAVHDLWPTVDEVIAYRQAVYAVVKACIAEADLSAELTQSSPLWSLLMGIEHARIHFETSSVLFRQLPVSALVRPERWRYAPHGGPAPERRWVRIPGRVVTLGRGDDLPLYGWDNEYGRLDCEVAAFEASAHLISNRDFHAFWEAGGYNDRRFWTQDGWAWREKLGVTIPRFWSPQPEGPPRYRAMFDELDMPWSWPAEVNGFEAQAYCRWVGGGARLLTEAEWGAIGADAPLVGGDCVEHPGYNLNLRWGSPRAVDADPAGCTALGVHDPYGNVWQWFGDNFTPLPGFAAHPLYEDFSAPYFDDQHAAMGGGAWASTGTSACRTYRLWFRRHFYQHAGFRIARSL